MYYLYYQLNNLNTENIYSQQQFYSHATCIGKYMHIAIYIHINNFSIILPPVCTSSIPYSIFQSIVIRDTHRLAIQQLTPQTIFVKQLLPSGYFEVRAKHHLKLISEVADNACTQLRSYIVLQTICDLRSGYAQKLKWFHFAHVRCRKSPFCRAIEQGNHAIVTGKDCKTSYQAVSAVSIAYCLYKTKQHVNVHNILLYYKGYLRYADFSHITLDILALQCTVQT